MKNDNLTPVSIEVHTSGVWRVSQLVDVLTAIDHLCGRVGIALQIAELFEAYDWAVRSYGFFGFLGGDPTSWEKPKSPSDAELRTAISDFVGKMRLVGIDVQPSQTGIRYALRVNDLLELIPTSSRLEIESIHMASPGIWKLITAALKSNHAVHQLKRIFNAIISPEDTRRGIKAETETKEANAEKQRALARQEHFKADQIAIDISRSSIALIQDLSVAIDSLTMSLVNAGLPPLEVQKVLVQFVQDNTRTIALYHSQGLIRSIKTTLVRQKS